MYGANHEQAGKVVSQTVEQEADDIERFELSGQSLYARKCIHDVLAKRDDETGEHSQDVVHHNAFDSTAQAPSIAEQIQFGCCEYSDEKRKVY